jgi:hypothetical protein
MFTPINRRGPSAPYRVGLAAAIGALAGTVLLAVPAHAATAPAYVVIGATQKVMATQASVTGTATAQVMGARNEFVSFQIVLPGGGAGQSGVSVTTGTALSGSGGTIPNSAITIYREDYFTTTAPSAGGRATGPWPDVLIPSVDTLYGQPRNAFPVNVPANASRVAYIDILVPPSQPAGGYDGTLLITNSAGGQAAVPVHLDVAGFTLPSTSTLRSLFTMEEGAACATLYGSRCNLWSGNPADEQVAWQANYDVARLALDDRITIADPQFQPPTNGTENNFINMFMVPLLTGTAQTRLAGARMTTLMVDPGYLNQWHSIANANGFTGQSVTYDRGSCDEPGNSSKWQKCQSAVSGYKATWPGLPNVMTASIDEVNAHDPSFAITDDLAPVVDQMDNISGEPDTGDQHQNYTTFLSHSGKQVWMYTSCDVFGCGGTGESDAKFQLPWADYSIDTAASQNRAMGWLDYTYNATGELYWDTTDNFASAWTNQYSTGGQGDGTLLYPGTTDRIGGTTPIPLESLRMKMIRNGHQDYEYLRMAAQQGHATDAFNLAKSLYPSTHNAAPSSAAIESARRTLAGYITGTAPPGLSYTGAQMSNTVTVDGNLAEFSGLPVLSFPAGNNSVSVRIGWDAQNLYAAYAVTDATINVNETGRDGEVWDGDGVELMVDRHSDRSSSPDGDDYHLLVNTSGALTDEQGTGSGWNRAWTSGASTAVVVSGGGYTVEMAVPWSSLGGAPAVGDGLGLDVANNDSDAAGQVSPFDWAGLTKFAQPNLWGTLRMG